MEDLGDRHSPAVEEKRPAGDEEPAGRLRFELGAHGGGAPGRFAVDRGHLPQAPAGEQGQRCQEGRHQLFAPRQEPQRLPDDDRHQGRRQVEVAAVARHHPGEDEGRLHHRDRRQRRQQHAGSRLPSPRDGDAGRQGQDAGHAEGQERHAPAPRNAARRAVPPPRPARRRAPPGRKGGRGNLRSRRGCPGSRCAARR